MKKTCSNCLYEDMCDAVSAKWCRFFVPLDEDADLDKRIEDGRNEFRAAWVAYMKEDDQDSY